MVFDDHDSMCHGLIAYIESIIVESSNPIKGPNMLSMRYVMLEQYKI